MRPKIYANSKKNGTKVLYCVKSNKIGTIVKGEALTPYVKKKKQENNPEPPNTAA